MSEIIAQKASELAADSIIMNSYKDFYNGKGYFLTKNAALTGAKRKPPRFPDSSKGFSKKWIDSNWFVYSQRVYLLILARIDNTTPVKDSDYARIKEAYNKWDSGYYVVIYGGDVGWACNLFVGETLYWAGKSKVVDGKYYSAKQIWSAQGGFKEVDKKNIERGDIVAFGGYHVEVVTRVTEKGIIFKDKVSFCSRGAGRGPIDIGTERCNDPQRQVSNNNVKFLRVS